jgi:hypothetical protein
VKSYGENFQWEGDDDMEGTVRLRTTHKWGWLYFQLHFGRFQVNTIDNLSDWPCFCNGFLCFLSIKIVLIEKCASGTDYFVFTFSLETTMSTCFVVVNIGILVTIAPWSCAPQSSLLYRRKASPSKNWFNTWYSWESAWCFSPAASQSSLRNDRAWGQHHYYH